MALTQRGGYIFLRAQSYDNLAAGDATLTGGSR